MIYYLAHPYSNDPAQSIKDACLWTKLLRDKDLVVFSPILHTHHYHEFWMKTLSKNEMLIEDYVAWDLAILEEFKEVIMLLSHTAFDPDIFRCFSKELLNELYSDETEQGKELLDELWRSRGCQQEYEKAKILHIPVYELEPFLDNRIIEL